MLTFLHPSNNSAVILDQHLNHFKTLETSSSNHSELPSPYELNFVNDGSRALFFYDKAKHLSTKQSAAMGFVNGTCRVRESTFREMDFNDEERIVYRWAASKRIKFNESVVTEESIEQRCNETDHVRLLFLMAFLAIRKACLLTFPRVNTGLGLCAPQLHRQIRRWQLPPLRPAHKHHLPRAPRWRHRLAACWTRRR